METENSGPDTRADLWQTCGRPVAVLWQTDPPPSSNMVDHR